jgi:flagellar hook-length control protein FliK
MLESKNIFLDIGRPATLDAAGASDLSQETAAESPGQFAAVFGNAAATLKVAKSGNELPQSGDRKPAQNEVSERDQALFFSRTLKGGTALIIGGDEPTDEGLIAFARAQGMDPQALGLLTAANGDDALALNAAPAVLEPSAQLIEPSARVIKPSAQVIEPSAQPIEPSAQAINADLSQMAGANLTSGFRLDAASALAADTGPIDQTANDQEAIAVVNQGSGLAAGQLPVSGALFLANRQGPALANNSGTLQITAHQLGAAKESQINPALINKLPNQPVTTGLDQTALAPQQNGQQGPLAALAGVTKNLHIKAETVTANGKLSVAAQSDSTPQSQPEMAKVTIGPQAAEAFLKQHRGRQNLPATKTEAISLNEKLVAKLIDSKAVTASGLAAINPAPLTTATSSSFFTATHFAANQGPAEPADMAAELLADTAVDDPALEPLRRQDEYTQLSRQLTDALGRRLAAQIQNGSWKVEMDLHPKTLGRVEVQLEMKNGQLEAQFVAANAATRDLINEGMPRLREAFLQHGTETAYINLATANQGFSDGNSTAPGHGENGLTNDLSSAAESDSSKTDQLSSATGLDNNGLDILV